MNTARTFTRSSKRLPIKADGNCFYNSIITALSDHPLFEPGKLTESVVKSLDLNVPTLTVDALKMVIIQSRPWTDRMLGMYRTWTGMDREQQMELLEQYAEQFPAFIAYVSTNVDSTRATSSGGRDAPIAKSRAFAMPRTLRQERTQQPSRATRTRNNMAAGRECLLLCSLHPYLRFSYPFRPRPESATFLLATMRCTVWYDAL